MKSVSASSTARLYQRYYAAIRVAVVAAVWLLISYPVAAQTNATADLLPSSLDSDSSSTVVPIQTPEQLLARPFRSIADVVRGEQTVRTRSGIGFRVVNVRAEDEVWLVSAREHNQSELSLQRLVDGHWITASMNELTDAHAMDQQKSSVVYVHGNRTDDQYARSRGLQFYENVFNSEARSGPVRFVIFAWRSDREKIRPTSDFNVKLDRSVELGPTFAGFIDRFNDRRIVLSGFSLGGQVVLSGLSQLQLEGMHEHKAGRFQVLLITPALKAEDALNSVAPLPQNPAVAKTVVFVNQKDSAIRAAMLIAKTTSAKPAVTLEQIAAQACNEFVNPVVVEDMTAQVTSCHSITKYSAKSLRLQMVANQLVSEVRGGFEWACPACQSLETQTQVEVAEQVIEGSVNEKDSTEISFSRADLVEGSELPGHSVTD